jgi:hypothetical protein
MFGAVPIIIIRWASHIPFFMTVSAKGYYNAAVSLGSFYDTLPHGHAFLHGLAITGYMVSAAHGSIQQVIKLRRYSLT